MPKENAREHMYLTLANTEKWAVPNLFFRLMVTKPLRLLYLETHNLNKTHLCETGEKKKRKNTQENYKYGNPLQHPSIVKIQNDFPHATKKCFPRTPTARRRSKFSILKQLRLNPKKYLGKAKPGRQTPFKLEIRQVCRNACTA